MPTCTEFIEPLNLKCLLVNTFAETNDIFLGVAFIVLASMAAYFRMPTSVFLGLMGLFIVMMTVALHVTEFLILFVAVGGLIFWSIKSRVVKT